jgi:hypothetical protein
MDPYKVLPLIDFDLKDHRFLHIDVPISLDFFPSPLLGCSTSRRVTTTP